MPIQPGLPMVLLGLGFVFFNLGFWAMYITLMRRKALGSWRGSFARFLESFRNVESSRERLVFRGGPAAMALGAVFCFSGVGISDARTTAPCVAACEEAGHTGGRIRSDPFVQEVGERSCWCYDGSNSSPDWVARDGDAVDPPR